MSVPKIEDPNHSFKSLRFFIEQEIDSWKVNPETFNLNKLMLLVDDFISKSKGIELHESQRQAGSTDSAAQVYLNNKSKIQKRIAVTNQQLEDIKSFITNKKKDAGKKQWYEILFQDTKMNYFKNDYWKCSRLWELNCLYVDKDTNIKVQSNPQERLEQGVRFDPVSHQWKIDIGFFTATLGFSKSEFQKAIRLYLFHEALHIKDHNLTDKTVKGIGNFPRVIEEADYIADVYAILNELATQALKKAQVLDAPKEYIIELINVAIKTIFSFDFREEGLSEIQIRRLNRYLIWHWQLIVVEKSTDNLETILNVLSQKPIIELSGPKIVSKNQRTYFLLDPKNIGTPELAIFYDNTIVRKGKAENLEHEKLIEAVSKLDSTEIKNVLESFYDQLQNKK